ncbi:MAG: LysR family transcriptional regulator [Alphaproteobacteria bacterium]|nr:LysR family transcriptional regulator [Alphaproteobacteria bacterium]
MPDLDIDLLRAFVVVADLSSFTAAGDVLGATQSAISIRIGKLEERTGQRLLARTPRSVRLTPEGSKFVSHAKSVLEAHDRALAVLTRREERPVIRLAISDQAAGGHLSRALGNLRLLLPDRLLDVVLGVSAELLAMYERGDYDIAIIRQEIRRVSGKRLYDDPLVWAKGAACRWSPGEPVPLVALRGTCAIKTAAIEALEATGLAWRAAFIGGSVLALQAAVAAGFGIAPLGRRHVPAEGIVLSEDHGLPALPAGRVVMLTRLSGEVPRRIATCFEAASASKT